MTSRNKTEPNVINTAPDQKKLNAHPPTRERLEAIADPIERIREASEIAYRCYRKHPDMMVLRAERRIPIVALCRYFGWSKAEVARQINARDRRVVDSAFITIDLNDVPPRWRVDENTPEKEREKAEAEALAEAQRVHAAYVDREAQGVTAREVRRTLIANLREVGHKGVVYKPSELAELTGRTPSLISQNLTGSSNRKKRQVRAEKRRLKELEEGRAA